MSNAVRKIDEYESGDSVKAHEESLLESEQLSEETVQIEETVTQESVLEENVEEALAGQAEAVQTENKKSRIDSSKIFFAIIALALMAGAAYYWLTMNQNKATQSSIYISNPQVNDLYYLDFRLISDELRPGEKYRMARVVDMTGDVITLSYSSYFYLQEHELNEAIRYGQLRYAKFFQEKRHDFHVRTLSLWQEKGALLLARRPIGKKLDGNLVVPDVQHKASNIYIPGKKQNISGIAYRNDLHVAGNDKLAFQKFEESAKEDFAEGKINLAQMYLSGTYVEKDVDEALYWLREASLQSNKRAILKYILVCKRELTCDVEDFYDELIDEGINIKVNE
ncbi:MAG: tetratricopeptide repeat protein [Colwellia sp.]